MADIRIVTTDLDRYYQDVARADGRWAVEMNEAHRVIAERGAEWARWEAASGAGRDARGAHQRGRAIPAIRPKSTAKSAAIAVSNTRAIPYALSAFYGAKQRTGWFAAQRYRQSTGRQFPAWVGNTYDVGAAGQGPYALNDAIAKHQDDIDQIVLKAVDRATANVYPDGRPT